jgi:predicted DNA-binding transcriptional regulator AlpA
MQMSDRDFSNLPDRVVVTEAQLSEITSLCPTTLYRMRKRGEGPPRVQLSARRVGYRMSEIRKWLNAQEGRS